MSAAGAEVNVPRINLLTCLAGQDTETGQHICHCLNFDIIEFGKTEDEAWENLKVSVKAYIEYCYTNYREGLAKSAAAEEWARFAELLKTGLRPERVDQIVIELKPPLPETMAPIWMQGVTSDVSSCSHVC